MVLKSQITILKFQITILYDSQISEYGSEISKYDSEISALKTETLDMVVVVHCSELHAIFLFLFGYRFQNFSFQVLNLKSENLDPLKALHFG